MVFASVFLLSFALQAKEVRLEIQGGRFKASRVHLSPGAVLRLVNQDDVVYTIESPGAFAGDVRLEPRNEAVVGIQRGGSFVAMIEEQPDSEVSLQVDEDPAHPTSIEAPFDRAKAQGLQPYDPTDFPAAYGAITQFNLAVIGQSERQKLLTDLYQLQEDLAGDQPPTEFQLYFSKAEWTTLRSSIAMVIGLGSAAFDSRRFGQSVAASKPQALHPVTQLRNLGLTGTDNGQRDLLVRVTSDNAWFNLRVCRALWKRLGTRIKDPVLAWGYSGPAGRSPILGGFYDGTGNPSGLTRQATLFGRDGYSMLAFYRIRFDETRFTSSRVATQEATIGRQRMSGKPLRDSNNTTHKAKASLGKLAIVRMPLVFDEGAKETGLLFMAGGRTFGPLEVLLKRMFSSPKDRLLNYMHFESASYYAIPPSPKGGYPGSLRESAFTFGS